MRDDLSPEEKLRNFERAMEELLLEATPEEMERIMLEDAAEKGEDPVAQAEHVRQLLRDGLKRHAERDKAEMFAASTELASHPPLVSNSRIYPVRTVVRQGLTRRFSRRGFFEVAAAFSVGPAAAGDLPEQFITRSSDEAGRNLIERVRPAVTRVEILNRLLRPNGRLIGVPGGGIVNPSAEEVARLKAWEKIGFPHDRAALDAYAVFAHDVELVETESFVELSESASVVTTGSPAANKISQLYLPYRDEATSGEIISRTFAPECIPYHYEFLVEKRRRRVPHNASDMALAPHKGVRARGVTHLADTSGNGALLKHDFLLISRLPRWLGSNVDIVNVGGGFGPGTEAVKLLFDRKEFPDSQVRDLANALGEARYFQVAFVCDLDDNGEAHNLRIWDRCPPVRLDSSSLRATLLNADDVQDTSLLPIWSPDAPSSN